MLDIYAECLAAGIQVANHCSDLYIPVNRTTFAMVERYVKSGGARPVVFANQVEGGIWYDIPFAYTPYFAK